MSELGNKQRLFWYVHAVLGGRPCAFAVAAFSADSAKRQVQRKYKGAAIDAATAVEYTHAWMIDHRLARKGSQGDATS